MVFLVDGYNLGFLDFGSDESDVWIIWNILIFF